MARDLQDGRAGSQHAPPLVIASAGESRRRDFIAANTAIRPVAAVPEIRLHQADEAHALWHRTEEELAQIGLPPPFWAFAWVGGQALARHVLDNPQLVRRRRVADFASGSGLAGISACMAGARCVTCFDTDVFSGSAVSLNAALNGVEVRFSRRDLLEKARWSDAFDVILAGDIFYERGMAEAALGWIGQQKHERLILVGDPGRSYFPRESFRLLRQYRIETGRALEDSEFKSCGVWTPL